MDDQNTTPEEIVDGEIVDTQISTSDSNSGDQATVLLNLESLIKNHIISIDRLQSELKKHREMLEDAFSNDPTYKEHNEKVKEATKVRNGTKAEILKQPSVFAVSQKVRQCSSELKEIKSALSDYLKEYQRLAGVNEIEGDNGEIHEIVTTHKVVKRNSKNK